MPDFLYKAMNISPTENVDRWMDVRWDAPATMLLNAGATPTGKNREDGSTALMPHIFTPETNKTTHYFFAFAMPLFMGEAAIKIAEEQVAGLSIPFSEEDLPMLEDIQNMMGDASFESLNPISLAGDAAGIRARRVLKSMLEVEQASLDD